MGTTTAHAADAKEQRFLRLFGDAVILEEEGNYAGAEAKMSEALRIKPGNPEALYSRAFARHQQRRYKEALADIDESLKARADLRGYILRMNIRFALNDLAGALADADTVLWENAEAHEIRKARAHIYARQGKHSLAIEEFRRLKADQLDDHSIAVRADSELALGKNFEAKLSLQRLLNSKPNDPWVHYRLGHAHFALQEFKESIAVQQKAESLKANRGDTQRSIGYCYYGMGDYTRAIESLKRAVAAQPTMTPYAYMVLHLAVRRAGRALTESPLREAMIKWESAWPKSIARYLLGELSDRKLVDEAMAAKDKKRRDEQLCEAYYYIGAKRHSESDTVAAEVFFERVLGTRASSFIEYTFARAELRRR